MKSAVLVVALMSGLCADSRAAVLNAETRGASPAIARMAFRASFAPPIKPNLNYLHSYLYLLVARWDNDKPGLITTEIASGRAAGPAVPLVFTGGCMTLVVLALLRLSKGMYFNKRHHAGRHRRQTGRRMMA